MHRMSLRQPRPAASRRHTPWIEALENRVHQSFAIEANSYISDISGYSLFAEVCYGDNGDPWGQEEVGLGNGMGSYSWSDVEWDSDLSDGFDSGHRLHAKAELYT